MWTWKVLCNNGFLFNSISPEMTLVWSSCNHAEPEQWVTLRNTHCSRWKSITTKESTNLGRDYLLPARCITPKSRMRETRSRLWPKSLIREANLNLSRNAKEAPSFTGNRWTTKHTFANRVKRCFPQYDWANRWRTIQLLVRISKKDLV